MRRRLEVFVYVCVPRCVTQTYSGFIQASCREEALREILANFGECNTVLVARTPYMEAETDNSGWVTYRRKEGWT